MKIFSHNNQVPETEWNKAEKSTTKGCIRYIFQKKKKEEKKGEEGVWKLNYSTLLWCQNQWYWKQFPSMLHCKRECQWQKYFGNGSHWFRQKGFARLVTKPRLIYSHICSLTAVLLIHTSLWPFSTCLQLDSKFKGNSSTRNSRSASNCERGSLYQCFLICAAKTHSFQFHCCL